MKIGKQTVSKVVSEETVCFLFLWLEIRFAAEERIGLFKMLRMDAGPAGLRHRHQTVYIL